MPAGGGGGRHGTGGGFDSNSLPTAKSFQSNTTKFPHPTVIVANEPYTSQLYLENSTWFLFPSVYFDTKVF